MSFALITTRHFERRARKFLRKHPDLRSTLEETLADLSRDPFLPQLRLHPLAGTLAILALALHASSLSSARIFHAAAIRGSRRGAKTKKLAQRCKRSGLLIVAKGVSQPCVPVSLDKSDISDYSKLTLQMSGLVRKNNSRRDAETQREERDLAA